VQEISDGLVDTVGGSHIVQGLSNNLFTNVEFANGNVTVTPKLAEANGAQLGWKNELIISHPGTFDPSRLPLVDLSQLYPLTWEDDTLYEVTVELSAPDEIAETNPPDLIRLGMDPPIQEVIALGIITPSLARAGTPKQGAPQTYRAFVHGNSRTLATLENFDRLRPRMDVIVHEDLIFNTNPANLGGITLHNMTVRKVRF